MKIVPALRAQNIHTQYQPGQSITLHFYVPPSEPPSNLTIRINETLAQDLLCDLGPPLRKYWKEDNRISEVWAGGGSGQVGDWDERRGSGCKVLESTMALGFMLTWETGQVGGIIFSMD